VALGFVDDAKDVLRDALGRFPEEPALLERASRLGLDQNALAEAEAPPPPAAKAAAAAKPPAAKKAEPPPAPEPPAASAENDLLSGLSFDDLPPQPPPPAEVPPGFNMRVADAAPVDDGGIDLGAELSALFDAQTALVEAPLEEAPSASFGD